VLAGSLGWARRHGVYGALVAVLACANLSASACNSGPDDYPSSAVPYTFPPGVVPRTCSGSSAYEIPAAACPPINCTDGPVYALCVYDGTCNNGYEECSCVLPAGWTLVGVSPCLDSGVDAIACEASTPEPLDAHDRN
jgi:hypothetical protein